MVRTISSKETSQIAVIGGSKRSTVNGDNLKNIRHEVSRYLGKKKEVISERRS
jgi:hypothetical protein